MPSSARPSALRHSESGAVAIIFALALIPVAGIMAGAVDFARQASQQSALQEAADAGALAAAQYLQANWTQNPTRRNAVQEEAERRGRQTFAANALRFAGEPPAPTFSFDGEIVTVSARGEVPTTFLRILGMDALPAAAFSEAAAPVGGDVEIAFVLDYSWSMVENGKFVRMAEAAQEFIAKIRDSGSQNSKIALIPFRNSCSSKCAAAISAASGRRCIQQR